MFLTNESIANLKWEKSAILLMSGTELILKGFFVILNLTAKSFCNLKIIVRGIFKRARKKNDVQFGIAELISNMEI